MQQADRALGRFDFDRDGEFGEGLGKHLLPLRGQVQEPAAAIAAPVRYVHLPRAHMPDRIVLMVALHRVEPRACQPLQRRLAFRPTVDQVAHREQPVAGGVETQPVQAFL
ncbi:hypothetical protein D3C87_1472020 [compost metagenome]